MSADKMNIAEVYEMFETINNKLDKRLTNKSIELVQVDMTAIHAMTEQFEKVIEEVRKPVKVEHHHKIEIASNWVFLSLVVMALMILGLSYFIGNQRQSINQYRDNDLKYRYIKMQGQTNEEDIYRLEDRFEYRDSIDIVRKQVEEYERLVKEQAERMERAKRDSEEAGKLQKQKEKLKNAR